MKKLALTIAVVLGITFGAMAQAQGGGLFQRGMVADEANYGNNGSRTESGLILPNSHGESTDQSGTPIGSGIAALVGLGAAYIIAKKRKDE